eukprot:2711842-Amphidinium_carterae.2
MIPPFAIPVALPSCRRVWGSFALDACSGRIVWLPHSRRGELHSPAQTLIIIVIIIIIIIITITITITVTVTVTVTITVVGRRPSVVRRRPSSSVLKTHRHPHHLGMMETTCVLSKGAYDL